MAQVDIHSEIPEEHPNKKAVEQVFREILASDGSPWTVMILLIHGIFWTVFLIRDDDVPGHNRFRKVLLLDDAKEQRPAYIAASLRALLHDSDPATQH